MPIFQLLTYFLECFNSGTGSGSDSDSASENSEGSENSGSEGKSGSGSSDSSNEEPNTPGNKSEPGLSAMDTDSQDSSAIKRTRGRPKKEDITELKEVLVLYFLKACREKKKKSGKS